MSPQELASNIAREAAEVVASSRGLPYAALLVSSVVLGFEVFRG
jgi:hypothetical protein